VVKSIVSGKQRITEPIGDIIDSPKHAPTEREKRLSLEWGE
jgi:hypothetical protein